MYAGLKHTSYVCNMYDVCNAVVNNFGLGNTYWEAAKKVIFSSGQSTKAFSPPTSLGLVVKRTATNIKKI